MRINLVTPFAEKDAVKALGARWDPAKKCWYITDVADLTPFLRWIPNMEAAKVSPQALNMPPKTTPTDIAVPTKHNGGVADCGCDVLPWEDCVHTTKS